MLTLPENMADHPRYGRAPRVTSFEPNGDLEGRLPGWKYADETVFMNTGVKADPQRQHGSAIPIYVYYDVQKTCADCCRPFLFFAEEQKYWFEHLGLSNDADCLRCVECRKQQPGEEQVQREYKRLLAVREKEWQDYLELTHVALDLFALKRLKSTSRIRAFIEEIPETQQHHLRYRQASQRLIDLEQELEQEMQQEYEQSLVDDEQEQQPELAA